MSARQFRLGPDPDAGVTARIGRQRKTAGHEPDPGIHAVGIADPRAGRAGAWTMRTGDAREAAAQLRSA